MGSRVARGRASNVSVATFCKRVLGLLIAPVLVVTGISIGAGVASAADPLIGRKYSDAAAWVSRRGTPVVATVSGSQLPLDDCIVVSWSRGGFLNSRGRDDRRNHYYLNLNCNNAVASPGHPGNSVMTPEGARGKRQRDNAKLIAQKPERCYKDEKTLENCRKICESTRLCKV